MAIIHPQTLKMALNWNRFPFIGKLIAAFSSENMVSLRDRNGVLVKTLATEKPMSLWLRFYLLLNCMSAYKVLIFNVFSIHRWF